MAAKYEESLKCVEARALEFPSRCIVNLFRDFGVPDDVPESLRLRNELLSENLLLELHIWCSSVCLPPDSCTAFRRFKLSSTIPNHGI
jgi:hypothetical protein